MGTYLDKTGLGKVWAKVKEHDTATLTAAKNYTDTLKTTLTDGTTVVKTSTNATNALNDADGNKINTTYTTNTSLTNTLKSYATTTDVTSLQQGLETGDIVVEKASQATKATQDGSGNKIVDTYATKNSLSSYVKTTDFIDADKIDVSAYGQNTTIGQFQGLDEFITLVDGAITDINDDINAITALTETEINEVCV